MRVLAWSLMLCSAVAAAEDGGVDVEALQRRIEALEAKLAAPDAGHAVAESEAAAPVEAPFSRFDWSWLNGSNAQPASLLRIGPVVPTFFVDAAFAWQFSNPEDHTIFPTTTAPRHSEFNLNLAYLGFELSGIETPWGSPIGRLELQMGATSPPFTGKTRRSREARSCRTPR